MNRQLQEAEDALLDLLSKRPAGVTMLQIIEAVGDKYAEPELRAAVWTLKARGAVDFQNGQLRLRALAA